VRFSGVLQHAKLEMVLQSSSGLTFGTVTYYKTNPRRYSPLQKTKKNISGPISHKQPNRRAEEQFHLPLSIPAFQEYQEM
jgi:hypothetical protein